MPSTLKIEVSPIAINGKWTKQEKETRHGSLDVYTLNGDWLQRAHAHPNTSWTYDLEGIILISRCSPEQRLMPRNLTKRSIDERERRRYHTGCETLPFVGVSNT